MSATALRDRKALIAAVLTLAVFVAALAVLHHSLQELRWHDVVTYLGGVPASAIAYAVLCSAGSYTALTLYDSIALRIVGKPLPYPRVALTSFIAYAIAHNVGLASVTGGSVRLRAYAAEGLSTMEIAVVVGLCSLTFVLGASLMLGFSLLLEAGEAASVLHVSMPLAQLIGAALLALLAGYLLMTALRRAPVTLGNWTVHLPRLPQTLGQLGASCLDLGFAAATLYLLLPQELQLHYPAFLGLYVIAIAAGVISNVPGGLGVFESVLILLLPQVPTEELLGSILLYRVLYYFAPFGIALVLLAGRELLPHRQRVFGFAAGLRRWLAWLAPQALAMAVFAAGAVLLFSGSLPAIGERLEVLGGVLPLGVLEVSHLIGSVIGVALLVLARGLFRRLDGAWWLAMVLMGVGIVASLLKGFDYEEASLLAVVMLLLYLMRKRFYRRAPLLEGSLSPLWLANIAVVVIAAVWLGFIEYRSVAYAHELWWQFALDGDAPRMLRASLVAVLLASAYALWQLLGHVQPEAMLPSAEDLQKAETCIAHTRDTVANLVFTGDKQLLFAEQGDAFIMYQRSGRSWIALGDPMGNPQRHAELAWRYRELCDEHGGWPVFYQVSSQQLPLYLDLGLTLAKLGEEARVPLATFSLEGPKRAELRTAHRKGAREGLEFAVIPPQEVAAHMDELRAISDAWLAHKTAAEKGFSVGNFTPDYLRRFPCAVARREGKIVAFANLWRSGDGGELSVDLMRYGAEAPKGVMDYLFICLMLWGRENGYEWFNLGMAPLSGLEDHPLAPLWHKLGLLVHRYGEHFYNFDGLRRYKEKFHPVWRPRYLASPGGMAMPRILLDTAALIAGGIKEVVWK